LPRYDSDLNARSNPSPYYSPHSAGIGSVKVNMWLVSDHSLRVNFTYS